MIPQTDTPLPCLNLADLFSSTRREVHNVARKLCATCDIRVACLEDALIEDRAPGFDIHGTRGGVLFGRDEADPDCCGDATGTPKGYGRHKRAQQDACEPCEDAQREYNRTRLSRAPKKRKAA